VLLPKQNSKEEIFCGSILGLILFLVSGAKHRENTKREMANPKKVNLPKSQHKHKMTRGFWWQVDFFMQMDFSSNGVVTDKKSS